MQYSQYSHYSRIRATQVTASIPTTKYKLNLVLHHDASIDPFCTSHFTTTTTTTKATTTNYGSYKQGLTCFFLAAILSFSRFSIPSAKNCLKNSLQSIDFDKGMSNKLRSAPNSLFPSFKLNSWRTICLIKTKSDHKQNTMFIKNYRPTT